MNKVVIFAPPYECVACRSTKMRFDRLGIMYDVIEADETTMQSLRGEGFAEFPVVRVDCGDEATYSWSGYRHDRINELAQLFVAG